MEKKKISLVIEFQRKALQIKKNNLFRDWKETQWADVKPSGDSDSSARFMPHYKQMQQQFAPTIEGETKISKTDS